jgi:hypothetical protein
LRGTESAWQALSYGLTAVGIIGQVGGVYLNFGLWGIAILPAWLVLRHFGVGEESGAVESQITRNDDSGALQAGSEEDVKREDKVKAIQG